MTISNKYTKALLLSPVIFLISCADMSETKEDTLAWDATNYTMYNEFMTCTAGDKYSHCLLYTSDAADDSLRVDLGGRRIIKKNL